MDTVFIAGKAVKQGGQLVGVDLARIRREAEQSAITSPARQAGTRTVCCAEPCRLQAVKSLAWRKYGR